MNDKLRNQRRQERKAELKIAQDKWLENERNGIWQPACEKPEFRTEEEIFADFLENGFQ